MILGEERATNSNVLLNPISYLVFNIKIMKGGLESMQSCFLTFEDPDVETIVVHLVYFHFAMVSAKHNLLISGRKKEVLPATNIQTITFLYIEIRQIDCSLELGNQLLKWGQTLDVYFHGFNNYFGSLCTDNNILLSCF